MSGIIYVRFSFKLHYGFGRLQVLRYFRQFICDICRNIANVKELRKIKAVTVKYIIRIDCYEVST